MTQTQPDTIRTDFRTESRTFTWATPGQGDPRQLMALDGLGQLQAMVDGAMPPPPIMATLGFTDLRPERGRVVVEMPAAEFHYNPLGGVHGGVISALLDTAAGCAVHSTLGVGEGYTSLDLTVKFLRPVTVDSGLLTAEGHGHPARASHGPGAGPAHRRAGQARGPRDEQLHDLLLTRRRLLTCGVVGPGRG